MLGLLWQLAGLVVWVASGAIAVGSQPRVKASALCPAASGASSSSEVDSTLALAQPMAVMLERERRATTVVKNFLVSMMSSLCLCDACVSPPREAEVTR